MFIIDINLLEVEMCSIRILNIFLFNGEVGICTQNLRNVEHPRIDDIAYMMETRGVPLDEMYDLVIEYERSENIEFHLY